MLSLCFKRMHPICKSVAKITLFVLILERLTGAGFESCGVDTSRYTTCLLFKSVTVSVCQVGQFKNGYSKTIHAGLFNRWDESSKYDAMIIRVYLRSSGVATSRALLYKKTMYWVWYLASCAVSFNLTAHCLTQTSTWKVDALLRLQLEVCRRKNLFR